MAEAKPRDFDEITSFLGDFGRFQLCLILTLSIMGMSGGYLGLVVVFVADTPEFYCKPATNQTFGSAHNRTDADDSSWIGPDSCSRYIETRNWTAGLGNVTEKCVDGWVFSTEMYTSTVVSEWDLVCDNAWKVPFSNSVFYAGALIGIVVAGHISDRFGRKPVFYATLILQTVSTFIQASSVNWVMYCVFNCLRGVGQSSNYIASHLLGSEMLSKTARVTFNMVGQCLGYGLGYALLPLFAYLIRDWRMLMVATAIPGVLYLPTWWLIPESPRWLLQRGRAEEAELIIRNAAKRNRVPAPEVIFTDGEILELMKHEGEKTYTYMDLIRTRNMRNITFVTTWIWTSIAMIFYGISLNTSNLNGNAYLNCFISAVIDIVGYVAARLLMNRVPRNLFLSSTLMFCGIVLLTIQLFPEGMLTWLAFVGKMAVSSAFCQIYVFFTELIPTLVRNMGLGFASTIGRIGAILSPYVIYVGVYNKNLPYVIFGSVGVIAAALSMLLPDTRNKELPDRISQARPLSCFRCSRQTATDQADATEGCKEVVNSTPC